MTRRARWSASNPRPTQHRPGRCSDYVGMYANDYWGPATVTEQDGGLQLALGPRTRRSPLTHWDGDIFTFTLDE